MIPLIFRSQVRISDVEEVLLIRGLFLLFLLHFIKLLFCRVLASVCEAKLRICAEIFFYKQPLPYFCSQEMLHLRNVQV